jgi:hypothetical protein
MPVLLAGRDSDDVARSDFLNGITPSLDSTDAGGDDQHLAARM